MKTLKIIPLLLAALALVASRVSANDRYTESMQKNIQTVYTAKTVEEIQSAVNSFERIGDTEKSKWEPYYYAGYGYIMMAIREKDVSKKDAFLDLSLKSIEKGKGINSSESELVALEGFAHMIRVTVDPATRGQQYSPLAMQAFGKAMSLNPDNPRALAFMAQMQYGMAQFFGSSTAEACGTLTKAFEKFESFKPASPLTPQWGKQMADELKTKCN